jgi:hypothetical protein
MRDTKFTVFKGAGYVKYNSLLKTGQIKPHTDLIRHAVPSASRNIPKRHNLNLHVR